MRNYKGMNEMLLLPQGTDDLRMFAAIEDELAPSTRVAYELQLRLLRSFYESNGWSVFDADPTEFVKHFLTYLSSLVEDGRSVSTLNKVVSALRWEAGYTNPAYTGLLSARPVKAFLAGVARQHKSRQPRKAKSLTLSQLESMQSHLNKQKSMAAIRNRAMLALGIATALRSSSLGELQLGDISRAVTMDGLIVSVRFSKTDQTGEGVDIPVKRSDNRLLDPVRAVDAWIGVLRAQGFSDPSMPLFPRIRGTRAITVAPIQNPNMIITSLLRDLLVDVGILTPVDAAGYSSHSLRATFITLSSQADVSEASIAAVSGHKSMRVLRSYDRSTVERHGQTDYLGG